MHSQNQNKNSKTLNIIILSINLRFILKILKKEIVVIIGGPGTGKTAIINALSEIGYCCYPEISREVTMNAKAEGIDQLFLEKPLLFSEMLLEGRKKQYQEAVLEVEEIVFLDRGIPDVLAYMHYIGDEFPSHFEDACHEYRYHKIFLLPPWEEIYVSDEARYENFAQSKDLYSFLSKTYQNYGYQLIEVPRDTVEKRIEFILNVLNT